VTVKLGLDDVLAADQNNLHRQFTGSGERPLDFDARGVVTAHCIYGDRYHDRCTDADVRNQVSETSITSRPLYLPQ
jgi:hypothetical protein